MDRLDKFDRLLSGDAADWLDLIEQHGTAGEVAEVVINKPVAEARQQAVALKAILSELRQVAASAQAPAASPAAPGSAPQEAEGDYVDQLAAQRAKRLADASGR